METGSGRFFFTGSTCFMRGAGTAAGGAEVAVAVIGVTEPFLGETGCGGETTGCDAAALGDNGCGCNAGIFCGTAKEGVEGAVSAGIVGIGGTAGRLSFNSFMSGIFPFNSSKSFFSSLDGHAPLKGPLGCAKYRVKRNR